MTNMCHPPPPLKKKFPAYSSGMQYYSTCIIHTVIPVGISVWMTSTWLLGLHTSPIKETREEQKKPDGTYKLTNHYKKMVGWGGFLMVLLTSWVNIGLRPILHTSYQVPDDSLMAQTLVCKNRKCHSYIHLLYTRLYCWHRSYLFERKCTEVLNIFNKHYSDSQCTIKCLQLY